MRNPQVIRLVVGGLLCLSSMTAAAADAYKTMNISLPIISFGGQAVTKFEWNMKAKGALGLELNLEQAGEVYSEGEIKEKNGDSLIMKGTQLAVFYSQFGNPKMMSGGFWGVGLGYRSVQGDLLQTPTNSEEVQGASLNEEGKMNHELSGTGVTGHARVGYRYVAESIPFSIGAYIGLRHFQGVLKEKTVSEEAEAESAASNLKSLDRRFMSSLEPGIELGLAF